MGEYKANDMNMPPESNSADGDRNENIDKKSLDEMNEHVSIPPPRDMFGDVDVFGCGRRKSVAGCTRAKDPPNWPVSRVNLLP